jgi:hypothetical protein
MSEEHIYSAWISRKLKEIGVTGFRRPSKIPGGKPRKSGAIDTRTYRVVCEPCNNVWLGNIEKRFLAPFFFDMVQGKPTVINETIQVILTFWLTRLAMAYEFVNQPFGSPTFFSQSQREQFRLGAEPPEHTRVWVASYNSGGPFHAHVGSHCLLQTPGDFRDGMFVVTGIVGCFAYQFFSRRWLKDPLTEVEFDRGLDKILWYWKPATIPLWPESPTARFAWPTPPIQGWSGLELFSDRLGGETRIQALP